MEDLTERLKAHLSKVVALHAEGFGILKDAADFIRSAESPLSDMVDLGYLLRDCERHHDELRKDAKAHQELAGKVIAYRRIQDTMNEECPDLKVQGNLATGTPELKSRVKIPKKGTPEYAALCAHFGITNSAIDGALFSPHYVRIADYAHEIQEAGGSLPPGVELGQPHYSTIFRKRTNHGKK